MTGMTRRQAVAALGASTLVGGLGGAAEETIRSEPPSPRELLQQRHLPNVELFTQYGDKVRFYDDLVKDKKVMINFMYSRCTGICSPVTSNMVQVCRMLGDRVGTDISMYSITLTPRQDPPRVLRHYAQSHGVGPGWLFLTGDPKDVESLRQGLGFTFEDPVEDADRDQHIGMLRYGNEPLMRWAGCPALAPAEHVARTILWEFGDPSEIVSTPAGQLPSARGHGRQHT